MPESARDVHQDFATFAASWQLSLDADGYAENTRRSYGRALAEFAGWLAAERPGAGPVETTAADVRGWVVAVRDRSSSGTARSLFAGLRHFYGWLQAEGERADDPTRAVKTPAPNDPKTPVLSTEELRRLLATCSGSGFRARRDRAIILLFVDGGLRVAELVGLTLADVNVADRIVYVAGKGSRRSGPRHRAVPLGVKAAQALDRYLRERRKHPHAAAPRLWLGDRGRDRLTADGVSAVLDRRCHAAGVERVHPHQLRHTWAHAFRLAGGSDGDLMVLGGWRNRAMLDRYGASAAADRAREAARRYSLGDRL